MRNLHPQIDALLDRRAKRDQRLAEFKERVRENGMERYFPHYFQDEPDESSADQ